MADDRRRAQNWRTTGGRTAGGTGGPRAEPGKKRPGGRKRFLILAAILALAGVIAGLIAFLGPPPKPIFLGVAVTEYTHPSYPPNAWAQQDSEALRQLFPNDSEQAFEVQEKHLLLQKFQQFAARTTKSPDDGRPMIVHLSALGVSRGGKAYLLPGNAEPSVSSSWLALEEILGALSDGKSPCILLLDLARPLADARLGVLSDDVAATVHEELTRAESNGKLPFLVLTACAAGQFSQTSPELRRSIFGYFIEQGLHGRADGWGGGARDDRVSARELAAYTIAQVAHWAANHRLPPQTPTLYGKGDDFVMYSPKQKPSLELPGPEEPRKYPEWLEKGWAERDNWVKDESYRLAPRTFRQLEAATLRAEQRWLAGVDEDVVRDRYEREKTTLIDRHNAFLPSSQSPRSLAEATLKLKPESIRGVADGVRPLIARLQSKTPLNPAELPMVLADGLKGVLKPPPEPTPVAELGLAGLNGLTDLNDPTQEQLKAFDEYFTKFMPEPRPAELLLVKFLVEHNPRQLQRWLDQPLPTAKRLILQSGTAAERAAVISPRTFPWVSADLNAANELRRRGLLQLATGESTERADGVRNLEAALAKYRNVEESASTLDKALTRVDDALILLPAVAPALANRPADSADERLWNATHAPALKLQPLLKLPEKPGLPALADISTASDTLSFQLSELRGKFQTAQAERLASRGNIAEIRLAIQSPTWESAIRTKLYNAARDQSVALIPDALTKASKLQPGAPLPNLSPTPTASPAWRARLAIDLLKMDGATDTKSLEALLDQAKTQPSHEVWEKLGVEIRKAWATELSDRFMAVPVPTSAQRQMGFVVHPFDVGSVPTPPENFQREPAALIRRDETSAFWNWLAERRYLADGAALRAFDARAELIEYGKKLDDVGRELNGRKP